VASFMLPRAMLTQRFWAKAEACGCLAWTQLGQPVMWKRGAVWQREPKDVPSLVAAGTRIVDVACGTDHTIALDEQSNVWAWGRGEFGQLFGATKRPFTSPPAISPVLSASTVRHVLAVGHCSCALDEARRVLRCVGRGCDSVPAACVR